MLFCIQRSTSLNPVSLRGVTGGQGFLARHLCSTSLHNDLSIPSPPVMTEQLPPSRNSLTPTSYLLVNFLPHSLVNRGMYAKDYLPILGPGIPDVTTLLHNVKKHLVWGEYTVSTSRLVMQWTMLGIWCIHVSPQYCWDLLVNTKLQIWVSEMSRWEHLVHFWQVTGYWGLCWG